MFEMTADGELMVVGPVHTFDGLRRGNLVHQIGNWADEDRRGWTFGSKTGFILPNGARRSPCISWLSREKIKPYLGNKSYWQVCPDFVVEVRPDVDRIRPLQKKLEEYIQQGSQLGWLVDPENQTVMIYRPDREVEVRVGIHRIDGEGPVATLSVDLAKVWDPFED